mgnify:CR=1 FL=1
MHYLPFGARLNKGILMVTQLILGFFGTSKPKGIIPTRQILINFV